MTVWIMEARPASQGIPIKIEMSDLAGRMSPSFPKATNWEANDGAPPYAVLPVEGLWDALLGSRTPTRLAESQA
jgi:hypothetical protein